MLEAEGVLGVVAGHELWLVDRLAPECVAEPFVIPPDEVWENIVPALRFIRDHVEPSIGDVRVVSAYRNKEFNACISGASQSAHLSFQALDIVPLDSSVSRASLIEALCPLHANEGQRARIGLGIYAGQRFHIDTLNFRGWGADHRGTSFPCGPGG